MFNEAFLNWTATFYLEENVFNGVESICQETEVWTWRVQICCWEWELFTNSCGVKYTTWRDVAIKIPFLTWQEEINLSQQNFPIDSSSNRHKYTFKLNDCIGYMWEFQTEDIWCISLPISGLIAYKIIGFKISEIIDNS